MQLDQIDLANAAGERLEELGDAVLDTAGRVPVGRVAELIHGIARAVVEAVEDAQVERVGRDGRQIRQVPRVPAVLGGRIAQRRVVVQRVVDLGPRQLGNMPKRVAIDGVCRSVPVEAGKRTADEHDRLVPEPL